MIGILLGRRRSKATIAITAAYDIDLPALLAVRLTTIHPNVRE